MNITKRLSPHHFNGRDDMPVLALIMHSTVGGYEGSISWFMNPASKASTHYIVSSAGDITQCVEESNGCYGAGIISAFGSKAPKVLQENYLVNPNLYSIQIELVDEKQGILRIYPEKQYKAVLELAADIIIRHQIKVDPGYILMHKQIDPAHRSDPVGFWNHTKFINDLKVLVGTKIVSEGGEQQIEHFPKEITVTVTAKNGVNVRPTPSTEHDPIGVLEYKESRNTYGFCVGEAVNYIDKWWRIKGTKVGDPFDRAYIWAGATDIPDPDESDYPPSVIDLEDVKKHMTLEERTNRVAELEAAVVNAEQALVSLKEELEAVKATKTDEEVAKEAKVAEREELRAKLAALDAELGE